MHSLNVYTYKRLDDLVLTLGAQHGKVKDVQVFFKYQRE